MLRCGISSSVEVLENFHEVHSWIPSKAQIRPPQEVIQKKLDRIIELGAEWNSMTDYLLANIFHKPSTRSSHSNRLEVLDRDIEGLVIFAPNEFPYQVSGCHWILWFGTFEIDKQQITNELTIRLQEHLGHDNFDFVWYENPKMTIPGRSILFPFFSPVTHYQKFITFKSFGKILITLSLGHCSASLASNIHKGLDRIHSIVSLAFLTQSILLFILLMKRSHEARGLRVM
jgi:hypothetical protein